MRYKVGAILLLILWPSIARAQDTPAIDWHLESIAAALRAEAPARLIQIQPIKWNALPTQVESKRKVKVVDWKFKVLAVALPTAQFMDTRSTFQVLRRCPRCQETNPYVRPFIDNGPVVVHTAGMVVDAGVMSIAGLMRRSDNRAMRRIWWVIPAAMTAGHVMAYRHNQSVGR